MTRRAVGLALAALLLAPALAGCSVVEGVIEQQTGAEIDLGGTELSEDFPVADVPLAEGSIINSSSGTQDGNKLWNVLLSVADEAAPDSISAQLTAAGFTSTGTGGVDANGGTLAFVKLPYAVNVLFAKTDGGWTANYTVVVTG